MAATKHAGRQTKTQLLNRIADLEAEIRHVHCLISALSAAVAKLQGNPRKGIDPTTRRRFRQEADAGVSYREIGDREGLKRETVRWHVRVDRMKDPEGVESSTVSSTPAQAIVERE